MLGGTLRPDRGSQGEEGWCSHPGKGADSIHTTHDSFSPLSVPGDTCGCPGTLAGPGQTLVADHTFAPKWLKSHFSSGFWNVTWLKTLDNPGYLPQGGWHQWVCDSWPGALPPPGLLGMAGTHRTLGVAQTLRARWEGWSPRGYWRWLWTDKDSQGWGLRWRGKCPRSKLQTAARPGNLAHNFQGEGKKKTPEGHCFKDLQQTKKGKLTHSVPFKGLQCGLWKPVGQRWQVRAQFPKWLRISWGGVEAAGLGVLVISKCVCARRKRCRSYRIDRRTCGKFLIRHKNINNKMRENTHLEMETK